MANIYQRKIVINCKYRTSAEQINREAYTIVETGALRKHTQKGLTKHVQHTAVNLLTYARTKFYIFEICTDVAYAFCCFVIYSKSLISENKRSRLISLIEIRQFRVSGNLLVRISKNC